MKKIMFRLCCLVAVAVLASCGGGGSTGGGNSTPATNTPGTSNPGNTGNQPITKPFTLSLKSIDVRRISNGDQVIVDVSNISSQNLTFTSN